MGDLLLYDRGELPASLADALSGPLAELAAVLDQAGDGALDG